MKRPTVTPVDRRHTANVGEEPPNVSGIVVGLAPQSTVAVRAFGLPGVDPVVVPEGG